MAVPETSLRVHLECHCWTHIFLRAQLTAMCGTEIMGKAVLMGPHETPPLRSYSLVMIGLKGAKPRSKGGHKLNESGKKTFRPVCLLPPAKTEQLC
eukprot:5263747-Amphidinium_carterae.1